MAIAVALFLTLLTAMAAGPRPAIDETIDFDAAALPIGHLGIDAWLVGREAAVAGLKAGAEKEIVWADPDTRARTPLSIVYLHGFSATKWETRPLADKVAAGLGANLFYTRLSGHGGDGAALASASMNDWLTDVAEAVAIAERLGDRVLIVGTSTGGTLAAWAARQPQLAANVSGIVLISPNFELRAASIGLLNMPWGKHVLPLVFGDTRSFDPINEAHGKWWTTRYPSTAVFAVAALLKAVSHQEAEAIATPALIFLSPDDKVVDPGATRRKFNRWGGPHELVEIADSGDPSQHVIAGDILSPQTTEAISARIVDWARKLTN